MPVQTPRLMISKVHAQQASQIERAHRAAATSAIQKINAISLATNPISNVHVMNSADGAPIPNWAAINLGDDHQSKLIDASNEGELKKFATSFPSYQNLSDSLVDNKIISPEAAKIPSVQVQIRKLHSVVRGLDPKDKFQAQQLANLHNHLSTSAKIGRVVKEEDFKSS
jgi:hypothetical protein